MSATAASVFNAAARLDEGSMWPTAFAVTEVDDAAAERIAQLGGARPRRLTDGCLQTGSGPTARARCDSGWDLSTPEALELAVRRRGRARRAASRNWGDAARMLERATGIEPA